ncbi:WASH complex subunit 1-like [Octopus sinensis]|uniref:WASH complex subunit 1-like n=1 Tax=Octopus sinensis TaxID=2607531 RepID=A0A7E6EKD3_9MOLL|nr:WASH complex subunit 1-like [Octopus sinensis]
MPNVKNETKLHYKLSKNLDLISQSKNTTIVPASFDLLKDKEKTPFHEGIGRPPNNLKSTGNFLIYNTNINAFKNYSFVDPLNVVSKITKPHEKRHEPAKAPETVTLGHQFDAFQRLNFDYNPILGDVPQIKVPESLPVLSG